MEANGNGSPHYEEDSVEADPTGRYLRYHELLGKGASKKVYKAFDAIEGREVAWNKISIDQILKSQDSKSRLDSELNFLKKLKHENILKFYDSWVDEEKRSINIITELFTSGSLGSYRNKHKHVNLNAIKSWARQILKGLEFLHGHKPPIIHRDLKCDNIFVNGNHGEVKIGDLGLATMMLQPTAQSVVGTPEFMAPELYEEKYTELIDIYSFGMCMLELVTLDYPYSECKNTAQIFKRVITGIKPAGLDNIREPEVREFVERCIAPASERKSAKELLRDPFLRCNKKPDDIPFFDFSNILAPMQLPSASRESNNRVEQHLEFNRINKDNEFRLKGEMTDDNQVSLVFSIIDSIGEIRNIQFLFFLDSDTAMLVASEMVEQLELEDYDVAFIANLIDQLITDLVPALKPKDNVSTATGGNKAPTLKNGSDTKSNGESNGSSSSVQINSTVLQCNGKTEERKDEEDLEAEIKGIETKFSHMIEELVKLRENELANARKRYV